MIGCQLVVADLGHLSAFIDPRAQQANLLWRKRFAFAFWRHGEVFIKPRDNGDQTAFLAVAGRDHRLAVVTPFQHGLSPVDAETALLLIRAMAGEATTIQQRLNVPLVDDLLLRSGRQFARVSQAALQSCDEHDCRKSNARSHHSFV